MRLPAVLPAVVLLSALAASSARAETVDPRYPFTVDLTGAVGFGTAFTRFGNSQFTLGSTLAFGFPVSEKRQVVLVAFGTTGSSNTGEVDFVGGAVGYRFNTFADPWRLRFDVQLAGDYMWARTAGGTNLPTHFAQGPGIGGRFAFAGQYYFFGPIFGAGIQISLSAFAINPHVVFDIGPILTTNW